MGYKQNRRIVRFGAVSNGVVLPKGWLDFNNLRQGDEITLLGDAILIIATKEDEAKARKLLRRVTNEGAGDESEV